MAPTRSPRWPGPGLALALLLALSLTSCNCDAPCQDACSSGTSRCAGAQVETCGRGADGCLGWSAPTDCAGAGTCIEGACFACPASEACPDAGLTRCTDAGVQTCATGPGSCLQWSAPAACEGQARCLGTTCAAFYLYAPASPGGTYAFAVDPSTGALGELPGSPFPFSANRAVAHPSGRFLYLTDENQAQASACAVQPDGTLTALGARQTTGSSPEAPAVSPDGRYLYVGTVYGGGTEVFAIDGGALGPGPHLGWGSYDHGVAFHPSGRWVYVSRNNVNDVTRFAYDAGTGAAFDPVTLQGAGGYHAAIDPLGRFLFVSDWDKGGADRLSSYRISVDDGTLRRVGDFATGGTNTSGVAVTPDGRFVYVVNLYPGTVAGFAVTGEGSDAGALTAVPGSPFPAGPGAWELTVDPTGRFLYVGRTGAISAFAVDPATGSLADAGVVPVRDGGAVVLGGPAVVPVPR